MKRPIQIIDEAESVGRHDGSALHSSSSLKDKDDRTIGSGSFPHPYSHSPQALSTSITTKLDAAGLTREEMALIMNGIGLLEKEPIQPKPQFEPGAEKEKEAIEYENAADPDRVYSLLQEQFAHLENIPIGRQDAAEKYGVPVGSIREWGRIGWVRTIERARGQGRQVIVNEKDVAIMAAMRKKFRVGKRGPIKGWKPPEVASEK